jgi:hypothetical protein
VWSNDLFPPCVRAFNDSIYDEHNDLTKVLVAHSFTNRVVHRTGGPRVGGCVARPDDE